MGSGGSKHKTSRGRGGAPSRPNSAVTTTPTSTLKEPRRRHKKRRRGSQDAGSEASAGEESRRSSVSYIPNGDVRGAAETVVPNGHVRQPSGGEVPVDSRRSSPSGTLKKQPGKKDPEVNNNGVPDVVVSAPDDGVDNDTSTQPRDYNGGGALPKSGSTQNLFSRLKNSNKKSSLQPLWEATRDESRKKLSQLCDVAFLSSGTLAISRSDGRPGLQLYSADGRPGRVLGDGFLKAPRGICPGNNNTVAVTDWADKTVKFMDMDGAFLGAWKTNKFRHPGGIVMNRDGRYVITDISRKDAAVGLYSPYGKLFRRFGTQTMEWPWYVTVDRRNRILVSERKLAVVCVFDEDGRYLFKFGGGGGGADTSGRSSTRTDDVFNAPGGIAVDAQNNILVADTDNYRAAMYSQDGVYIRTLVTTTFSRPISLAYDDGMVAMVTDNDLRVYKTYAEKTSF